MRDVLPDEVALRDWALAQILGVYRRHGFVRIETPAVESLRLLLHSEGGENEKLIYKILKRGDKLAAAGGPEDMADLGLRFDLTVPLVRYYAHNHARLPQPLKAIQIGPVWRAERPQQGRYRQFTQCDIDILGVASEVAEIELILATTEALAALGLKDLTVRINDRRLLGALVAHCGFDPGRSGSVFIALDKLDKVDRDGVAAELREAGHAPEAIERMFEILDSSAMVSELRALLGARLDEGVWRGLQRILDTVETQSGGRFRLVFDLTLVRGMGYYTGAIFEVQHGGGVSSIAGGGRYDRMVGKFIGRDVPATGFSIGFERVISILLEHGPPTEVAGERVALVFDESAPLGPVLALARDLREQGKQVLLEARARRLGKQLQDLETRGFRRIGVLGPEGAVEWREPRTGEAGEPRP
ncbi:MAG: histidine--tRNA ligase [Candidatus Rokuibacteriota bacterium]